ncbi:MAG: hypothetical protein HOP21_06910 [Methylotenera sp.]|nr:hypothetical protein [Methylotenera sp.]
MIKFSLDLTIKWLLLAIWTSLFIGGITNYTGSWMHYTVFSFVFLAMLISGLYRQVSYGYLFLVVMLWLGFWFKLTVHLLAAYPFGEPVGFFDGTPAAWDKVLLVATVGGLGVMVARLLFSFGGYPSTMKAQSRVFKAPVWYSAMRQWVWVALMVSCIALAFFNASLGILQIGLVPATILLWPLNAVFSWLIGYGFTLGIATLIWWDIALGRNISSVVYFILLEAFSSSVSILSRGVYIFHAIPPFLGLYKNRASLSGWSRKNTVTVVLVFLVLFAISNPVVNQLRGEYYSNAPAWEWGEGGYKIGPELRSLLRFSVDRWIGAEGVMGVTAYPDKGNDLFMRALIERSEIGKSSIYQEICLSHYRFSDLKKFQFASLPGAVGFFYFTGHLWVVAVGMIFLVFVLLSSERFVFRLTSNPLLCALWGGATANAVAQFGIAPRGLLLYFFELVCGVMAICFVQSEFFAKFLQRSNAFIKMKSQI